eukprot:283448-Amphidinium_carterae.1
MRTDEIRAQSNKLHLSPWWSGVLAPSCTAAKPLRITLRRSRKLEAYSALHHANIYFDSSQKFGSASTHHEQTV